MKKNVKKISLSRETLRNLDAKQVVGGGGGVLTEDTENCLTQENCGIIVAG